MNLEMNMEYFMYGIPLYDETAFDETELNETDDYICSEYVSMLNGGIYKIFRFQ